jgi:hypothetical protein
LEEKTYRRVRFRVNAGVADATRDTLACDDELKSRLIAYGAVDVVPA